MSLRVDPALDTSAMIVLIGGTGDVGKRLVSLLLKHTAASVMVVSRRGVASDNRVQTLRLNIAAKDAATKIPIGATVVNLTEATPPSVAAEVVRGGGNFLETSASPNYVEMIVAEVSAADPAGTGVVCVGAAPGLSTLMAADAAQTEGCASIDIGLELGMGRHYGAAATEWSIGVLGNKYQVSGIKNTTVRPGDIRRRFVFARGGKSRKALGLGFAQQGIVRQSEKGTPIRVRSFLALHPAYVTKLTGLLLRLGLGPILARHKRGLTRILMRLPPLGRVGTSIAVEARGADGGILAARHIAAGDQAEVTATMILATILALDAEEKPLRGATTIADHLTTTKALDALRHLRPDMQIEAWSSGTAGDRA